MTHLNAEGLAELLGAYPQARVLDVRFAHELDAGHLPGDHHVPWLTPDWEPAPDFLDRVRQHVSPNDYVVVICRSGHRSSEAAVQLENAGFSRVYNLLGGYEDFRSSRRAENAALMP